MLRLSLPWWEVLSVPGSTGTPGPTSSPVSLASMADTLTARRAPAPPAPAVPSTFTFDAIGTRWCIDTEEPLRGEVRDRILDRIQRFDRTYSRFRPDSLVAQ